jgi:hypothetical protein
MNSIAVELLVSIGIVAGAFLYGDHIGAQREHAKQMAVDAAVQQTREAAQQAAAEAISKIKITNTTVRGEVQHEIQTNTVYRDCKLPADGLRIANDAITGNRTQPAGGGQLPKADAAGK